MGLEVRIKGLTSVRVRDVVNRDWFRIENASVSAESSISENWSC